MLVEIDGDARERKRRKEKREREEEEAMRERERERLELKTFCNKNLRRGKITCSDSGQLSKLVFSHLSGRVSSQKFERVFSRVGLVWVWV